MSSAELVEYQLKSAEQRYNYEIRNRTLEYIFGPCEELIPLLENKIILDFGCFMGGTTIAWLEMYRFKKAYGIDTDSIFADGANLFAKRKGANAEFCAAFGEELPYDDESFDAIISLDVFEHVKDLKRCLAECKRVLKVNGHLLAIFPPYYHPMAHHLKVTRTPCLHWIFHGEVLRRIQNELIVNKWGAEYEHLLLGDLDGYRSPYLNGITVRNFRKLIADANWEIVVNKIHGFPYMGETVKRSRIAKLISSINQKFARFPFLEEITLDRIAMILRKK